MRIPSLVIVVAGLSLLTACSSSPQKLGGEAGPAGSPRTTSVPTTVSTSPAAPSPSPAVPRSSSPSSSAARTSKPAALSTIRRTDWDNVTVADLNFLGFGDARFRNGRASSGANNCTMLPGGARPFYGEYLTEEPADSPVTEDALILVECGSDGLDQALVPVQLAYDRKTRQAVGFIGADTPSGPDRRMTFTSFSVRDGVIVASVRKADGSRETRRYRNDGGASWGRF